MKETTEKPPPKRPESQEDIFKFIACVLAVPTKEKSLPSERKWILPCPDDWTLADYPESEENLKNWKQEWTSCIRETGKESPKAE